jgi:hypothetical protein
VFLNRVVQREHARRLGGARDDAPRAARTTFPSNAAASAWIGAAPAARSSAV